MYHWRNFPEKHPILLWDKAPGWQDGPDQDPPSLTPYEAENPRGIMVICPGGGYEMKASHEAEDIALFYQKAGISSYVLNYRVAPFRHPLPLLDVRRGIRFARSLHPGLPLAVIGFSAGGHLATCAATLSGWQEAEPADEIDRLSDRPDCAILCYPVVTLDEHFTHMGSRRALLGETETEALVQALSLEKRVTPNACPCFLWHTAADEAVPVENSLNLAAALSRAKVPFELHIFPEGRHGMGLAEEMPDVAQWADLTLVYLKKYGF